MPGPCRTHLLVLLLLVGLSSPAIPARDDKPPPPGVALEVGEAGKLVPLPAKEWAKLVRTKVEVKGKGDKGLTYEGVSLAEVLRFAGLSFAEHPRGRAESYVLVEGSDGYRAVVALAEVDPKLTDRIVLLADRLDGKPLAEGTGPQRLIVPSDRLPSRWVKQVVRISVRRAGDEAPAKK
jgi:DMSO/TMAO reductase YedYZ molybdopterin-dependent catalytic subunit